MSKTRPFRRNPVIPVDHPDGGTFHLIPLTEMRETAMQQALRDLDFERDERRAITVDGQGQPIKRVWADPLEREEARLDTIRRYCVDSVSGFVDADKPTLDDGSLNTIAMDPRMITLYLSEYSDRLIEVKETRMRWDPEKDRYVPVLDEAGQFIKDAAMKPAHESYVVWVIATCRELASYKEAEAKNSSGTPNSSSPSQEAESGA